MPAVPRHRRILGDNIRVLRRKYALSQERLAEKANLNPGYLSEVECGKENISVDAVHRIALALKVDLADLFRLPAKPE